MSTRFGDCFGLVGPPSVALVLNQYVCSLSRPLPFIVSPEIVSCISLCFGGGVGDGPLYAVHQRHASTITPGLISHFAMFRSIPYS